MERKDDRKCAQCGYPLKGLPRRGNCPECGNGFNTATGEGISLQDNHLSKSEKVGKMLKAASLGGTLIALITCMGLCSVFANPGKVFWWFFGPTAICVAIVFGLSVYDLVKKKP